MRGRPTLKPSSSRVLAPDTGTFVHTATSNGGSRASVSPSANIVLRPEAVRERLLRLEEALSRREELRRLDARAPREGFREVWAVERGLQLGAEIVLDVGNSILSAHFGVSAQDYETASVGVLPPFDGLGGAISAIGV